jgi:hypothetical protein
MMFSLHPIHVEPVAGLVGRADLLYSFLTLCAIFLNFNTGNNNRPIPLTSFLSTHNQRFQK